MTGDTGGVTNDGASGGGRLDGTVVTYVRECARNK